MRNYEAAIAISGTHGKTTTTSMLSEICVNAELDPTITVGGILPAIGGNLRVGAHKVFITEACEYCNSFLSFNPTVGIILNIEEDHLDFFKDIDDIRLSFRNFALKLPASGLLIINSAIDNYNYITEGLACPFVTFGLDTSSTYSAQNISYDHRGCAQFDLYKLGQFLTHIHLAVPGEHNIIDALASCAAADALSIQKDDFVSSLNGFHGTERRFEYKGSLGNIQIYDDYAHHPTEITATISAARKISCSRLVIVFQPHTYTRTKAFLTEFAEALSHADLVILTDIYAAREKNTIGISSKDIQTEINKLGTKCLYFSSFDAVEKFLLENSINGDLLITMGAGDVVNIGENLLGI